MRYEARWIFSYLLLLALTPKALSPPLKLKGLRSRADFEIEFIQIKQNLQRERIYSPQAVAKLGLPGQVRFPEPQSTHCWQHPAGHFPWTLNIRFPQPPASFSVSLIFLSRVLAGCRFSNNCTRRWSQGTQPEILNSRTILLPYQLAAGKSQWDHSWWGHFAMITL